MSIVIVGVGNADFTKMEILDGDDVHREEFLGDIDEVFANEQFTETLIHNLPLRQDRPLRGLPN